MLTIPDRTFHAIAESPLHRASWDCDLLQAAHTPRQQSVGTAQKSEGSGHPLLPLNGNYQEKRCIRTQWSDRLSGQAVGSQLLSGCVSHVSERVLQWDQPTVRSCIVCRETSCTSTRERVRRAETRHRAWRVFE